MHRPRNGRRAFLKASGVSMALPFLESIPRAVGASAIESTIANQTAPRMVCIGNMLGFYPPTFFPEQAGADYVLPKVLEPLASHQDDMTVISGLDHGVKGGHFAIHSFLSGVRSVDAKSMPEANISIDQRAAEAVGGLSRFPSLTIGSEDGIHGGCQMCWNRSGTRVPPITGPSDLFRKLFVSEDSKNLRQVAEHIELNKSILDSVRDDAKILEKRLNTRDRQKLDEYFTSVREVERQLQLDKQWTNIPKPKTSMAEPEDDDMVSDLPELYDLIALALQTDSTRIATLEIAGGFNASALGFRKDHHALSHHGQIQESIDALIKIESYQVEQFARFLDKLKSIEVAGSSLFEQTMVLFGSGMGNANAHTNSSLPIILAGGLFEHGQHLTFEPSSRNRPPLTNLYVSMLQQFGLETDKFATSSGTLTGLEMKS